MVIAYDIAEALHKRCIEDYIPNGISPEHSVTSHSYTTSYYADYINNANMDVTGEEVVQAILASVDWDGKSQWPGHPRPELVVEKLRET